MITYKPLWKTLIDKNMNKARLRNKLNCSWSTINKMTNDEYVSLKILDKICKELNCNIDDVIKYEKDS